MSPMESQTIDLDNLFQEYQVVPLETGSNCLIGILRDVQMLDERIMVQSMVAGYQELLIFNSDGKFINKIKRGQGPGEIKSVQTFCADEIDQSIWIADNNLLQHYNSNGDYLGRIESPVFNIVSLIRVNDVFYCTTLMGNTCSFNQDSLIWQINNPKSENITGVMTLPNLVNDNGYPLLFSSDYRTVFAFSLDTLIPFRIIDFGEYNLPMNGTTYNMQDPAIIDLVRSKGFVTGLSNFKIFENGFVFTGGWKDNRITFIHFEKPMKNIIINGLRFGLVLNTFPLVGTYRDKLICKLSPDVISEEFSEYKSRTSPQEQQTYHKRYLQIFSLLDTLDINANPVFLIGKIRK